MCFRSFVLNVLFWVVKLKHVYDEYRPQSQYKDAPMIATQPDEQGYDKPRSHLPTTNIRVINYTQQLLCTACTL